MRSFERVDCAMKWYVVMGVGHQWRYSDGLFAYFRISCLHIIETNSPFENVLEL